MSERVEDTEVLYRRVIFDPVCFEVVGDKIVVTSTAFNDRHKQPSVDRAKLCNAEPAYTQGADKRAGVVSLITEEVRSISLQSGGETPQTYIVDVVADPVGPDHPHLVENPAHAEIRADPSISSKGVFQRLRRSLALLAQKRGWLILPDENR